MERILSMVDGVCLIVDIVEGPRTQTKFVLKKALSVSYISFRIETLEQLC